MANPSYFAGSHGFVIESGGNFATVQGNQILNYFNREPERKTALTLYDQFRQVILGDIYRTEDLGVAMYPRRWDVGDRWWREEGEPRADRTICVAQVIGVEGRVFTMVSYNGPEAREAFEKDFQTYSRRLTAGPFQVYGINTNAPTVLFYDEHQPLAKFWGGLGFWGRLYLRSLSQKQFKCRESEIWLDPRKGELCPGPAGPECDTNFFRYIPREDLSCSAELLQDSNCLPFLASLKARSVDQEILDMISWKFSGGLRYSEVEVHQPTICSTSTNATVAVCGGLWWTISNCLGEEACIMEDGATRFTLKGEGEAFSVRIYWEEECGVWISQALSVFHAHGISLDDSLSQYVLTFHHLELSGNLSTFETLRQQRREKTIYLFIGPLSSSTPTKHCTTSSLHYWSFDPTGQHPLPPEICKELGLPNKLSFEIHSTIRRRWDNEAYKWMNQYQVARGFDSKTTDFARYLGFPIYQVQHNSDRFEDVDAQSSSATSTSSRPGGTLPKEPTSLSGNRRSISGKAVNDEEGTFNKHEPPQMTQEGPAKDGLKATQGIAWRGNIHSQSPPKATSTPPNPCMSSKTPGNVASHLSTELMPSVSTPPPVAMASPIHSSPAVSTSSGPGDRSPAYSQPDSQSSPFPHAVVSTLSRDQLPYPGESATATAPISHTSPAEFSGSEFPNGDHTGRNASLLRSSLPHSDLVPVPSVSSLEPSVAALPPPSLTSEDLQGWSGTDASSLQRKNRDTSDSLDTSLEANTKGVELLETSESDLTSDLRPPQEAECGGSLERLESDGVGDIVRGKRLHMLNEIDGSAVRTSELKDENRQLREEIERLKEMEEHRRLKEELERLKETLGGGGGAWCWHLEFGLVQSSLIGIILLSIFAVVFM